MFELINTFFSKLFNSPWGTVVGILIGGLIGHYLAIGRDKRKTFNWAGNEFIDAFKDFVVLLKSGGVYERDGAGISCPIPDHIAAAIKFRRHLKWFQAKRFNRELAKYKIAGAKYDDEVEKCLGVKNVSHDTNLELIKLIDSLLKYANPK